jgi:tetratricopeptide (TPR) repeat protein/tRNA A-37 threonylcarbamoyl transferase component Bud32
MSGTNEAQSAAPAGTQSTAPNATGDQPVAEVPSAAPPTTAGRYQPLAEIARGGMGVIWRATDAVLKREVAVKVLHDVYAPDSAAARRFAAEARITAQLQHPAIPPVYDGGIFPDGRPFLAMKLVKGQTLEHLLRQRSDPATERGRFLAVFEQVCQAVAYAHAHNVIHRDLKPGNVMVGGYGEIQVMDWGLAKVLTETAAPATEGAPAGTVAGTLIHGAETDNVETQEGIILGTLAFMPPEQAAGEIGKVDVRSDVFGLGAILAVILTGSAPYGGANNDAMRVMAIRGDLGACLARLDACGAEPELVGLCKRCLAFAPADRPRDAGAVAEQVAALRAAAEERARAAERERAAAEARAAEQRRKRHWQLAAAATIVVALLAGVGGLATFLHAREQANTELRAANQREHERFELALDAVKTFHTGVSEDALLQQAEFKTLRASLLGQAARFYGKLQTKLEGAPDPTSQRDLAQSYFLLAELQQKIDSNDEALTLYRKALDLRRALAAHGEPKAKLDVARSLLGLADAVGDSGDYPGTVAAAKEAMDIVDAVDSEEALPLLGDCLNLLGGGYYFTRDWEGCLRSWQRMLDVRKKLAEAKPDDPELRRKLATAYGNVGIGLMHVGKQAEGLEMTREAIRIHDEVARVDTGGLLAEDARARKHFNLGGQLKELGRMEEAVPEFAKAVEIEQKLIDVYPSVFYLKNNLAYFLIDQSRAFNQSGRLEESLQTSRKATKILQGLIEAQPTDESYFGNIGESHCQSALVLLALGKPDEALAECDQALRLYQRVAGDPPKKKGKQIAQALGRRGVALQRLARPGEAAAAYRKAIGLWEQLGRQNPEELYESACLYALLHGIAREKGSGLTPAEGDAAGEKAMTTLRRALDAGHRSLTDLRKNTDLDSLRNRPEFQKMLAELEQGTKANKKCSTARPGLNEQRDVLRKEGAATLR